MELSYLVTQQQTQRRDVRTRPANNNRKMKILLNQKVTDEQFWPVYLDLDLLISWPWPGDVDNLRACALLLVTLHCQPLQPLSHNLQQTENNREDSIKQIIIITS